MDTLNRREMLQWSTACGLGAMMGESGFSNQANAAGEYRDCELTKAVCIFE
jgi:hypothetical protein